MHGPIPGMQKNMVVGRQSLERQDSVRREISDKAPPTCLQNCPDNALTTLDLSRKLDPGWIPSRDSMPREVSLKVDSYAPEST